MSPICVGIHPMAKALGRQVLELPAPVIIRCHAPFFATAIEYVDVSGNVVFLLIE